MMKRRMKSFAFSTVVAVSMVLSMLMVPSVKAEAASYNLENPRTKDGLLVYDYVYFGNYWQSDNNGDGTADKKDKKEPIKWRVLSINGNDAFLMSDKILDTQQYHWYNASNFSSCPTVTWETCTMRHWLNGYKYSMKGTYGTDSFDYSVEGKNFIGDAFTSAEQDAIITTTVADSDNPWTSMSGGGSTEDKIYLLSLKELLNEDYGFIGLTNPYTSLTPAFTGNDTSTNLSYYIYDYAKLRLNTAFAFGPDKATKTLYNQTGGYNYSKWGTNNWWLRSPGRKQEAANVRYDGYLPDSGNSSSQKVNDTTYAGVVPVLHLDLSKTTVWKKGGSLTLTAEDIGGLETPYVQEKTPCEKGEHTWDKGTVIKAATVESPGIMEYKCTKCTQTKKEEIDKLIPEVKKPEEHKTAVESVQGDKVTTTAKGEAAISAIKSTSKKAITVKSTVDVDGVEYSVTTVNSNAFQNAKKATKVTLPNTIKKIKANAFAKSKITQVNITVKKGAKLSIDKKAFKKSQVKKIQLTVSKKASKKEVNALKKSFTKAGIKTKNIKVKKK